MAAGVFPLMFAILLRLLLLGLLPLRICFCVVGCIFHRSPRLLGLALDLLSSAFGLRLGVAGPFTGLPLGTSNGIVHCAFCFIGIHGLPPGGFVPNSKNGMVSVAFYRFR